MRIRTGVAILATTVAAFAQIPPRRALSPTDTEAFQAEIQRIERMLETAGDTCTVHYALARTWAAGGQYQKAIDELARTVGLRVGIDPSNDSVFGKLRATREFAAIAQQAVRDTPPKVASAAAFTIDEPDLLPEGIAFDAHQRQFFLGSTYKGKIVRCGMHGDCALFTKEGQDGLHEVLGLKIDPTDGTLWAVSNADQESALFHFSVPSGALIRKYTVAGKHVLNDLALDSKGNVFVTDTASGLVYRRARADDQFTVFLPALRVQGANGIAISLDDRKLYVAGFPDGITVVDLASRTFRALPHPRELCLSTIDGLSFYKGDLIAIQNGAFVNRVARLHLTPDGSAIAGFDVLEQRNPIFDGITTGAVADDAFYFMANTQIDKVVGGKLRAGVRVDPIRILRIPLR